MRWQQNISVKLSNSAPTWSAFGTEKDAEQHKPNKRLLGHRTFAEVVLVCISNGGKSWNNVNTTTCEVIGLIFSCFFYLRSFNMDDEWEEEVNTNSVLTFILWR